MNNTIKCIILFFYFLFAGSLYGQFSDLSAGLGFGLGNIKGNSPSQTALSGNINLGFKHSLTGDLELNLEYLYAKKINYFLPENRAGRYYPSIQAINLKAAIEQKLSGDIFSKQALGLSTVNDRTYSDVNTWDMGIVINLAIGLDHTNSIGKGFKYSVNAESALTMTSTTASYFIINIALQNYF